MNQDCFLCSRLLANLPHSEKEECNYPGAFLSLSPALQQPQPGILEISLQCLGIWGKISPSEKHGNMCWEPQGIRGNSFGRALKQLQPEFSFERGKKSYLLSLAFLYLLKFYFVIINKSTLQLDLYQKLSSSQLVWIFHKIIQHILSFFVWILEINCRVTAMGII